jgi:hypothetical protein
MFLHAAVACGTEILMCEGYQDSRGYACMRVYVHT